MNATTATPTPEQKVRAPLPPDLAAHDAGLSAALSRAVAHDPVAEALEHWQRQGPYDFHSGLEPVQLRRAMGKALRKAIPRESHAEWSPSPERPDPLEILKATNAGRIEDLVPLRMKRMAASPFAFFRGAAAIMARDLAAAPLTGLHVVIDGDPHLANFGMHGTPQREIVFDLNDFDETTLGPWEWDLKRLVASVNLAARQIGLGRRERRTAVMDCVAAYRQSAVRLQELGVLDVWYMHSYPDKKHSLRQNLDPKSHAVFAKALEKARENTSAGLLPKVAGREPDGAWRFRDDPPTLTRVSELTAAKIAAALGEYVETLLPERRFMMKRYRLVDIAHRVVGVGSVGLRAYLALFIGNGDHDPIFLQVKEARRSVLADSLPALPPLLAHEGRRVVFGQRLLQASTDFLLGWTTIEGRSFYVRQMRNMKAAIPIESLTRAPFGAYACACGDVLCRAHARTGDIAKIAGYCGKSAALDVALSEFAERYGDQTERDHAALEASLTGEDAVEPAGDREQ